MKAGVGIGHSCFPFTHYSARVPFNLSAGQSYRPSWIVIGPMSGLHDHVHFADAKLETMYLNITKVHN